VTISTDAFPRDELDMTLDFGRLKQIMRDLDHKIMVTRHDSTFLNPALFEHEGIVVLDGRGPSVENVAAHVWERVVGEIRSKFPDSGLAYSVEVVIQETENNVFVIERQTVV
jgi:6-pyruvoyl-tetrahydropterin synthase